MRIGLVGAGNMAQALATGWGDPVFCTDAGSGKAEELVRRLGGEALSTNLELAQRVDVVVLAHKPAQLEAVAAEIDGTAKLAVSLLAQTSLVELKRFYVQSPVVRVQPNLAVAIRKGVTVLAEADEMQLEHEGFQSEQARIVTELFERVGIVVKLPDERLDAAAACSGVGPAYWALVAEAQIDAAIRWGVPANEASILVCETMAGSAELLRERGYNTAALRREVASPGGTTARGLAALERAGVRAAFSTAIDDVLTPPDE